MNFDNWLNNYNTVKQSLSGFNVPVERILEIVDSVEDFNKIILYITSDGNILPDKTYVDDNTLVSHTYDDGIGKIIFAQDITNIASYAFSETKIQSVIIPDSVTVIKDHAFWRCYTLEKVNLGSSIESIEECGFYENYKLKNIDLPSSLKSIGVEAFFQCAFTRLVIPEGVTNLGERCFAYDSSLRFIEFPSTIENIGENILESNYKLEVVLWKSNLCTEANIKSDPYNQIGFFGSGIGSYNKPCIVFDDNVTSIPKKCYMGINSQNIVIPNHITEIGENAFSYNTKTKSVVVPQTVTKIKKSAFSNNIADVDIKILILGDTKPEFEPQYRTIGTMFVKSDLLTEYQQDTNLEGFTFIGY